MNGKKVIEILKIRKFRPSYFLIAIFFGIFARYPIAILKDGFFYFFPIPRVVENANILQTGLGDLSQWQLIAIIAVIPAIFEELTFRGIFLYFLEKKYTFLKVSVVIGLMFGMMHLNVFTFLETALLGILLTMITIRSGSIIPAVVFHFVNNAYSIVLMKMMENKVLDEEFIKFVENDWFSYLVSAITLGIVILMIKDKIFKRDRRPAILTK